jgi:hypothetical protein
LKITIGVHAIYQAESKLKGALSGVKACIEEMPVEAWGKSSVEQLS